MDRQDARKIGQLLALKSGLIGIALAYLTFSGVLILVGGPLLPGLLWIFNVDYAINTIVGALGLLTMGYFFGGMAGSEILIKNRNYSLIGIMCGILTLLTGTIIGSTLGFIQEGLDNIGTPDDPFFDYYFKPLYWVTIFGVIPASLVGLWFGKKIKRKGLLLTGDVNA